MDGFGEEDPAAEFLAGEQNKLADLVDNSNHTADGGGSGGDDSMEQPPPLSNHVDDGANDLADNLETTHLSNDDIPPSTDSHSFSEPPMVNGISDSPPEGDGDFLGSQDSSGGVQAPNYSSDAFSSNFSSSIVREEPEKIRLWRIEQQERLRKKDEEAVEQDQQWLAAAKKELEDWYRNRGEQLEKTKQTNREAEEAFVQERDATDPGQQWERIARSCEFNPKMSKSTKDTSRMRSILLQLKTNPVATKST